MTKEEKLKKIKEFNAGWKRLCPGQYRNTYNPAWQWDIKRGHATGKDWFIHLENGTVVNPMSRQGLRTDYHTFDDARRAVNQFVFDNNLLIGIRDKSLFVSPLTHTTI